MSKIHIEPKYADVKPQGYYVYIHMRASTGEPFYVGKGKGNRAWHRSSKGARGEYWIRCASKHGVVVFICQDGMTEDDAFLLEQWLIAKFRHEGVAICNISSGGSGGFGAIPPNSRPVICSNGMHFQTTGEAARWLGIGGGCAHDHSIIYMCCVGKIRSAHGYSWWYEGDPPKEYIDPAIRRKNSSISAVACSNGMVFRSTHEAAAWLREEGWPLARNIGINSAIRGRNRTAYGFAWWRYGEKEKKYIDPNEARAISNSLAWKRIKDLK